METICPLCNGLENIDQSCPSCSAKMTDGGRLADYLGPYSPYMNRVVDNSYPAGADYCVHLIYCPACGCDSRLAAQMTAI